MPTVKRYGQQRVSSQFVPGAKARTLPPSAFDTGAQGLTALGKGIDQMQTRIDMTEAEEAMVNFEREKNDLFFNADTGYFKTQGRNAYDGSQDVTGALAELQKRYSEGLTSQGAREMFDKTSNAHVTRGQVDIQRHATKGFQAWETATIKSATENTLENAALYFNDSDRLNVQLAIGEQNIRDLAELQGLDDPELLNEGLETYRSSFYSNAVQAAIIQSADEGQKSLEKYGNKLEGPELNKMKVALERKQKEERTRNNAIEATTRATNLMNQGLNYSEVLELVDSIEDPEVQKLTRSEVAYQNSQKKVADQDLQAEAFDTSHKFMQDGNSIQELKSVYPIEWERMSSTQRAALTKNKGMIATDWIKFNNLMLLPQSELAKVNPSSYAHMLADSEKQKLLTAVTAARKGESGSGQPGRTRAAQVKSTLIQIHGKEKDWSKEKRERIDSFYSLLNNEIAFREQQKGTSLSSDEFTTVLGDLTREYTIERNWWPDRTVSLDDLPVEDIKSVTDFLHSKGIPATSDNIIKAYEQAQE